MSQEILLSASSDPQTRTKLEGGKAFVLHTEFEPAGDQPTAIAELVNGIADVSPDTTETESRTLYYCPTKGMDHIILL